MAARIDSATIVMPTGLSRQKPFAEQQKRERHRADRQDEKVEISELTSQPQRAIEEIMPTARDAEQARQLAHDDGEPGAGLEADQYAVADQADEDAELEQPTDEAQDRDRKSRKAGDLRVSHCVPAGEHPDRGGNHQRNCRGRADRELPRRPEQRIADTAEHVAIDANLRRQAGERRIGQRYGNRVRGQRYSGHCVRCQPFAAIDHKPAGDWEESRPPRMSVGRRAHAGTSLGSISQRNRMISRAATGMPSVRSGMPLVAKAPTAAPTPNATQSAANMPERRSGPPPDRAM
ncbi:hypothetical protein ABIF91_000883 [Bradyrhizobium sp. USDA 241]